LGLYNLLTIVAPLVVSLCCLLHVHGSIADVHYIDQSDIDLLEQKYALAQVPSFAELNQSRWVCTLYGVRSKLQKEQGLSLFRFSPGEAGELLNSGSHIFTTYRVSSNSVTGHHKTKELTESLRVFGKNQLIGKMMLTNPAGSDNAILSYALCDRDRLFSEVSP
jgi:hypothetical protein